ncbi:class I SAM-dependent methyltransferase [Candidatus Oscillochloris fontis]|uniref:class I SAM-dependent methyltransferase n=1 Tax=Candidatus Oscillochloris fontis TaxID=2496868 RepID=UPI00101BBCE9|nr:class I SAM-dependent methyltransferase [Candidatus Oscillochloris fontis]
MHYNKRMINPHFTHAIHAFSAQNYPAAAHAAARATTDDPHSLLYAAAARYLARVVNHGQAAVYVTSDAFAAFIRGGGNLQLYAQTSAALRQIYTSYAQINLLDIGVGDGMALLPALSPQVSQICLVEPSAAMLAQTCAALDARGVTYSAFAGSIEAFRSHNGAWDVTQATFSLQSLPPQTRPEILAWLRQHTQRLLIAEFDVPPWADLADPARIDYFSTRYEVGLAEYQDDAGLVAQGFLMPVFFGCFDRNNARTNYEQPISAWADDLRQAGFSQISQQMISNYWWAPAYLLDAQPGD